MTGAIISKDAKKLVPSNKVTYKLKKLKNNNEINVMEKDLKMRGLNQVLVQIDKKNEAINMNK